MLCIPSVHSTFKFKGYQNRIKMGNELNNVMVFNREQEKAPRYVVCLVAGRLVKKNILFSYHASSCGRDLVQMVHIKRAHAKEHLINSYMYILFWVDQRVQNSKNKLWSLQNHKRHCLLGHKLSWHSILEVPHLRDGKSFKEKNQFYT